MKKGCYEDFVERLKPLQAQIEWVCDQTMMIRKHRKVYDETIQLVKADKEVDQPSAFWELLLDGHFAQVLLYARKMTDTHHNSISLHHILLELRKMSEEGIFTLDNWGRLFKSEDDYIWSRRENDFRERFTDGKEDELWVGVLDGDRKQLNRTSKDIRKYINKRVAHWDPEEKGIPAAPFGSDMEDLVELVTDLSQKYSYLISCTVVSPDITIAYNWQVIFQKAWKPPWKAPQR